MTKVKFRDANETALSYAFGIFLGTLISSTTIASLTYVEGAWAGGMCIVPTYIGVFAGRSFFQILKLPFYIRIVGGVAIAVAIATFIGYHTFQPVNGYTPFIISLDSGLTAQMASKLSAVFLAMTVTYPILSSRDRKTHNV